MSVDEFPIGSVVYRTSILGDVWGIVIAHSKENLVVKVIKSPPNARGLLFPEIVAYHTYDVNKL